jgi:hypothetical protein
VPHAAHERPRDPVLEHLLLGHEPGLPLGRQAGEAAEDEI